ncbi:MAG: peptidoglycan-binding protein [Allorhizobium sp.]
MNGSRSNSSRPGGTSSLDALNRTIEGLEARIEGLMSSNGRDTRAPERPRRDNGNRTERDLRADPLAEIRQRQRALEESRSMPAERRAPDGGDDRYLPGMERFAPSANHTPSSHAQPDAAARDITQALLGLRQELKHDITESLSREMTALRAEMRGIRTLAEERRPSEDMRDDIARLADGISQLGQYRAPGSEDLQAEFEELRSLMDGLAREDSVRHIERRWENIEERLDGLDPGALRAELLSLADRLDDIKRHLGTMGDHSAIRALEDKLVTVATALELIGAHIDPSERMLTEQFAGIDMRLDEISRAIAAGGRSSVPSTDTVTIGRIEDRIAGIARQIEGIADKAAEREDPAGELGRRLEALTARIEDLSSERTARRLEERLDQLSLVLERTQMPGPQPELTGYLADISRKIDALDHGSVNDRLAERLDLLAHRIGELAAPARSVAPVDDYPLRDLEERLNTIVERLEETAVAPAHDTSALRGLEEQIAHLSTLIGTAPSEADAGTSQFADRISALEDYMSTSDEYIIEAARQAAETVMESYSQSAAAKGDASGADVAALSALAEHLKQLEEFSRDTEERTHRTFEALHDTLVQIAERLDQIDSRVPVPAGAHAEQDTAVRTPAPPATQEGPEATLRDDYKAAETAAAPMPSLPDLEYDYAMEMAAPEIEVSNPEKRAAKPSLIAGIGKRLRPGQKKEEPTAAARTLVDPSPSIDPAEMLPPEEANELLEPGSGAPDVRKILERVRASQAAQRDAGDTASSPGEMDRTDYIAAARRAAQAAATEMDRTQRSAPGKAEDGPAPASGISRYRRPILLAVGAILLAAMAMPLVNTLTGGEKSPPVTAIETSEGMENSTAAQSAPESDGALADTTASETSVAAVDAGETPVKSEIVTAESGVSDSAALTAQVPLDESGQLDTLAAAKNSEQQAATGQFAPAPSEPATPASATAPAADEAAPIAVPDAIKPASLVIAAKQGDPLAFFEIGARYSEGRGVDGDFAEAAKWYRMAADKGFAPAMYRLANLYENGTGVERNVGTAKHYYAMAAEMGNASAMHNLAVIYASGADGVQDYPSAAKWFSRAAELGISDSQFNLGILNARGNGVPQDLEASYKWFAIAAKEGDKDAAQKRDEVANVMTPEQLEKARAAVDLWKPQTLDVDANSANTPDEWAGKGLKTATVDMKKAIQNIQGILNNNGFDAGVPDGVMGEKTVAAIKAFQKSIGQEPTGKVSDQLVKELLARNK